MILNSHIFRGNTNKIQKDSSIYWFVIKDQQKSITMPSKFVTNYDSMFSDLPNYPRQQVPTFVTTLSKSLTILLIQFVFLKKQMGQAYWNSHTQNCRLIWQEVTWELPGYHQNRVQNFGEVDYFAGIGGDVSGKDRSKFFKRPILPNTMPMPFIRYAKEIRYKLY